MIHGKEENPWPFTPACCRTRWRTGTAERHPGGRRPVLTTRWTTHNSLSRTWTSSARQGSGGMGLSLRRSSAPSPWTASTKSPPGASTSAPPLMMWSVMEVFLPGNSGNRELRYKPDTVPGYPFIALRLRGRGREDPLPSSEDEGRGVVFLYQRRDPRRTTPWTGLSP